MATVETTPAHLNAPVGDIVRGRDLIYKAYCKKNYRIGNLVREALEGMKKLIEHPGVFEGYYYSDWKHSYEETPSLTEHYRQMPWAEKYKISVEIVREYEKHLIE